MGNFGPDPQGSGGGTGASTATNVTVDASGFSGNLSTSDDTVQKALATINGLTLGSTQDLSQLQDVMAAIALQTYATAGLQEFPHTRIDTFVDDADLTGDYAYDEGNNCVNGSGGSYESIWTKTDLYNGGSVGADISYRQQVTVSEGGGPLKITLNGMAGQTTVLNHVSVGILTGTDSDTVDTPVEATFSSTSGVTINGDDPHVSDPVDLTVSSGQKVVVILDYASGSNIASPYSADGLVKFWSKAGGTYNQAAPGSMSWGGETNVNLTSVTAVTSYNEIDCHTTAFEASDIDPTSAYLILDMNPNTLVPGTGVIAKLSIDNGANKETFVFEADPILTISGDRALYRADIAAITTRTDQTVIAYFETDGVTSASNNPSIYGYVLGLAW